MQNAVHVVHLDGVYPLQTLAVGAFGRYDHDIFPAATCTIRAPFSTTNIFQSGRVVIPGPKNHMDALLVAYLISRRFYDTLGIYSRVMSFGIHNIVGSWGMGFELNLDLFLYDHKVSPQFQALWNPTVFPGLQYHQEFKIPPENKPKWLTFLIYESGKVVITGARTYKALEYGAAVLQKKLLRYKVGAEYKQLEADRYRSVKKRKTAKVPVPVQAEDLELGVLELAPADVTEAVIANALHSQFMPAMVAVEC